VEVEVEAVADVVGEAEIDEEERITASALTKLTKLTTNSSYITIRSWGC
jgi:hypothetical protein